MKIGSREDDSESDSEAVEPPEESGGDDTGSESLGDEYSVEQFEKAREAAANETSTDEDGGAGEEIEAETNSGGLLPWVFIGVVTLVLLVKGQSVSNAYETASESDPFSGPGGV